jgi:NitT/TauT family transport system substrate-binding protein|uniref:ABC-type nitrate/sulfonate/bicarbonate transport systems periplasmic components-like protein n=2 Tax=Phyllobacteriaceae TaxID=69277 RepID=Q11E39_CHESB
MRFKLSTAVVVICAFVSPVQAADKVTAAFSSHGFAFLVPLVADANGLFADEGIEAELTATGGDSKALAALVGGSVDVGFLAAPTVLKARQQNVPVKMLGYILNQYPTNFVMSDEWVKEHNITSETPLNDRFKALKNTTLGITSPGSGTDLIMRFMAGEAGLDPDRDLTLSTLGTTPTIGAAFSQGRIDGFALSAPIPEIAIANDNAHMIVRYSAGEVDALDGILYTSVAFHENMIEENPDLVVRFLRTQQAAIDLIRDPERSAQARDATWNKYYPKIDKAMFDQIWEDWKSAWPASIVIPEDALAKAVDFNNRFTGDVIELDEAKLSVDNTLAKQALNQE